MHKLLLLLALATHWSFGQYCTSGGPSSTQDSNLEWLTLNGESSSINFTGCPGQTGVQVYTAQTVTLEQSGSYSLNLQFGTCQGNYSGVGQVWIDFNHNFTFEAGESIGTWTGLPPTAASSFNFVVPAGAALGLTRMRVIQYEGGSLPINPCASFTWGSVTDFGIDITTSVDCSTYSGDDMSDPIEVNAIPYSDASANTVCYTDQNTIYPSSDVFYRVPVTGISSMTASLCSSSFDTFITVTDKYGNVIAANDDGPNCGNNNAEVTISTSAYDTVFVIVEGWGSASGNYVLNINEGSLELGEVKPLGNLIYPNPTTNGFFIKEINSGDLELYTTSGQLILKQPIDQKFVSTEELENGIYFIRVYSNEQLYSAKLIVHHD